MLRAAFKRLLPSWAGVEYDEEESELEGAKDKLVARNGPTASEELGWGESDQWNLDGDGTPTNLEKEEPEKRPSRALQNEQPHDRCSYPADEEEDEDNLVADVNSQGEYGYAADEESEESEESEGSEDEESEIDIDVEKEIDQMLANISKDPLSVPLDLGWRREIVTRQTGQTIGKKDVYYYSPEGKKFRSGKEVERFLLKEGITSLDAANFSFNGNTAVEDSQTRLAQVRRMRERQAHEQTTTKKKKRKRTAKEGGGERRKKRRRGGARQTYHFCDDLSGGLEKVPVQCINQIDKEKPDDFTYVTESFAGNGVQINAEEEFLVCCDCEDGCTDPKKCACIKLTSRGMHCVYKEEKLVQPVPVIYECNHRCKCAVEKDRCSNRVVQQGVKARLQVFKTRRKGWGVRCLDPLPAYTFVCCYAGEILTSDEAEAQGRKHGDGYLIDLDFLEVWDSKPGYEEDVIEMVVEETGKIIKEEKADEEKEKEQEANEIVDGDATPLVRVPWEECVLPPSFDYEAFLEEFEEFHQRRKKEMALLAAELKKAKEEREGNSEETATQVKEEEEGTEQQKTQMMVPFNTRKYYGEEDAYVINAHLYGCVGRFLNHSCDPNLLKQQVFVEHHDVRFPQMCFFTARRIPANTELTWNYNYVLDSVPGRTLQCRCGTSSCVGRLY